MRRRRPAWLASAGTAAPPQPQPQPQPKAEVSAPVLRLIAGRGEGAGPTDESGEPLGNDGNQPTLVPETSRSIRMLQGTIAVGLEYELGIDSFFGASHAIRPSGEQHSHSFRIQAVFITGNVDENGMICGFREVSDLLDAEAKRYSNRFINEIMPFDVVQPTGENLAAVVYRSLHTELSEKMPGGPELISVTLWENPISYVRVATRRAS